MEILVAQGYDAGAHTGPIGTFSLVPRIVDMAGDVPVQRGTKDSIVEAMQRCRHHLDAATYVHRRGNPKDPIEGQPIPPGVPALFRQALPADRVGREPGRGPGLEPAGRQAEALEVGGRNVGNSIAVEQ